MEKRFKYAGTGAGLFGNLFVGCLLCLITLGIYMPWFIAKMYRYVLENTTMHAESGEVKLDFKGQGGELFGIMFVGILLSMLTLGIYYSWFATNLMKYVAKNIVARDGEGREYSVAYNGTGGGLFVVIFVGTLLTMVTLGIYCPWFLVKFMKYLAENTVVQQNGETVATFEFNGAGGKLFGKFLVGTILTVITIGIYYAWFMVDLMKYYSESTAITVRGVKNVMRFDGTGGKLFAIGLVGTILSMLTLGIYGFWYMTNLIRFRVENTVIVEKA